MGSVYEQVDFTAGEKLLPASALLKDMINVTLGSSLENRAQFIVAKKFLKRTVLNSKQLANCPAKFKEEAELLLEASYEVVYEHVHGVQPPPVEPSTSISTKPKLKLVK
jgi:hypothetical protein